MNNSQLAFLFGKRQCEHSTSGFHRAVSSGTKESLCMCCLKDIYRSHIHSSAWYALSKEEIAALNRRAQEKLKGFE